MNLVHKGNTNMTDAPDKVDFQRSAELLHIIEKCAGHGPKLNAIASTAMNELLELNDKLQALAVKAQQETAKLKAEADAKTQAKMDAQNALTDRRSGESDAHPSIYPQDSQTATIADRRV
jgi:hypothetical protein